MKIGVPKEIKNHEYRVGLTPESVSELVHLGHAVFVEDQAGVGAGFSNAAYQAAGAHLLPRAEDVFNAAELIVKVKEPQPSEYTLLRERHTLFTYLHLAPDPKQTKGLMASGCCAIAYETVTDDRGGLPLLAPMSEVAGRMSIQAGAHLLEKSQGGSGVLLGGIAGVSAGKVVILGGGVVGANAARMAVGLGAQVVIFDKNHHRLNELDWQFRGRVQVLYATQGRINTYAADADLVIGAVLIAGAAAPRLISRPLLKKMRPGSVLVDVAIDQGGCFETSKPTTHDSPMYVVDDILHYCVTNMPGAVARTSTLALNNATLPFVTLIAQKGPRQALLENAHLRNGLNILSGQVTHFTVASDLDLTWVSAEDALNSMSITD